MRVIYGALVGAKQPPLGQRGDSMHAGQQLARVLSASPSGALNTPFVTIAELVHPVVARPAVCDDRRAWPDVIRDKGMERARRTVRQRRHSASAVPCWLLDLHRDASQDFLALGPAAAQPGLPTADVGLINLDDPGKPFTPRAREN